MDRSLSIVLSVHNAENTLAQQVLELLEVLPELTSRFELLIVDDGSTDHTDEVAHDLARRFPQLHVARHPRQRGEVASVLTGLERTSGDVLFVQNGQTAMSPGELRRLWSMGQAERQVAGPAQPPSGAGSSDLMERLSAWGAALEYAPPPPQAGEGGVRMIRRRKLAAPQELS